MFIQATISCECGCISRIELQDGRKSFVCPQCEKSMNDITYQRLLTAMGEFGDLNTDILKYASDRNEPKIRAISISIADLAD